MSELRTQRINNGSSEPRNIFLYDTGNTAFGINSDGTGVPDLFISAVNGRVGILTAAPSQALDVAGNAVITGTITGNQIVTIPLDVQTFYFLRNSTSGAYTVQFKYTSGSGDTFTFGTTDKGDQLVFATGNDGTNPDIYTLGFGDGDVTLTGTQTLTNKTLTSPKIGTSILDTNGNQLALLTATGSAVNEFTIANAATGGDPTLSATGDDSNIDIAIKPKGTGETAPIPPVFNPVSPSPILL